VEEKSMKKKQQIALTLAIIVMVAAAVVYAVISAKPGIWQVYAQPISGSGTQDTTEFSMNNMWRVEWVITVQSDPLFILEVYRKNDTGGYSWVTEASATDVSASEGILPVFYTGTFVMRVIASDETEWILIIEEHVPA